MGSRVSVKYASSNISNPKGVNNIGDNTSNLTNTNKDAADIFNPKGASNLSGKVIVFAASAKPKRAALTPPLNGITFASSMISIASDVIFNFLSMTSLWIILNRLTGAAPVSYGTPSPFVASAIVAKTIRR